MKNHLSAAVMATAALALLVSCNKIAEDGPVAFPESAPAQSGTVLFRIDGCNAPATKAPDQTATAAESAVSDVQILVFDSNGNTASYISAGTSTTATARLRQGAYTARAVVNGPDLSGIKNASSLDAVGIALGSWNSPSSDFVMGDASASALTVQMNRETVVDMTVGRFVSRVRLVKVSNGCPAALGGIVLKRAFLSNVVCNQNLGGTAAPSDWSNMYGRSNVSNQDSVIDGSSFTASPAELTFWGWNGGATIAPGLSISPALSFYSYPDSSSDAVKAWKSTFTATATRLVIVAEVNGTDFCYPVALPGTVRNCTYDVSVSITGEGLDDPQGDPAILREKGTVKASITVAPWSAGTEYNLEY